MEIQQTKNKVKIDPKYGFTDIEGASAILGLSKSKVYKACAQFELPFYKPAGRLIFKISELLAWIEAGKQ